MSVKIEESMKTALIKKYGHSLDKSENRMVTEVWDLMQKNVSMKLKLPEHFFLTKYKIICIKSKKDTKPFKPLNILEI